ncbi:MAG: LPXTG cell wall anchor domain-containing protein [Oscillospiraceae bacterium]|nr:LPXTG cell wall anchor domain-containing protein [Oscillospiraceae bacterium]
MLFNVLTAIPDTGNVSANTYLIIVIAAAGLIIGAVLAGIFTKKKK